MDAVVGQMDRTQVVNELRRNGTTAAENLKQMNEKLKRRITMTIGEITASALPDNSMISVLHHPSPDIILSNINSSVQKISVKETLTKSWPVC